MCLHGTPSRWSRSFPVHNEPSSSSPAPFPAACLGSRNRTTPSIHQGTSASPSGLGHKSNHEEETKRKKKERGSEERKIREGGGEKERWKEVGGDGCEIKGKNSSEITKLFIFPALRLWAFEASTLMYLDILGPSVTEATPAPQRHVGPISRGCPRSLLKWVLVVFTRLRVRNVSTGRAGRLPGAGWGLGAGRGSPHHS